MLAVLYPQTWLPYRYLWPFLASSWDADAALRNLVAARTTLPPFLLLAAANDEVIPSAEVNHLQKLCEELDLPYQREDVLHAFHNDASSKHQGRKSIARFVEFAVGNPNRPKTVSE